MMAYEIPQGRVTIDLDTYRVQKLIQVLLKAKYYLQGICIGVKIQISASRRGWHIVFYLNKRLSDNALEKLRIQLNDDFERVEIDRQKQNDYYKQTLFYRKIIYKQGKQRIVKNSIAVWYFDTINSALDFIDTYAPLLRQLIDKDYTAKKYMFERLKMRSKGVRHPEL